MKRITALVILACIFLSGCISDSEGSGVDWELDVGGDVDALFTITFDELLELDPETIEATMKKTTGSTQTNEWTGVPVEYFIERADPDGNVDRVILEAFDGYTVTLGLEELEDGIVAYEMDGERILETGPLRMVLPNMWGSAWMRGLTSITFMTTVGKLEIVGGSKRLCCSSPRTSKGSLSPPLPLKRRTTTVSRSHSFSTRQGTYLIQHVSLIIMLLAPSRCHLRTFWKTSLPSSI